MKKLLWSIPAIAIYFYVATVLAEYSYTSYFNIPANFVEASLKSNIVYFYQLFIAVESVVEDARWWTIFLLGFVICVILLLSYGNRWWKGFFTLVGTILMFSFMLYSSPKLGTRVAENTTEFFVPAANCPPLGDAPLYIAPIIGDGQAVFVPVDASNKMMNGFIVKDLAAMSCLLERKSVGKITK